MKMTPEMINKLIGHALVCNGVVVIAISLFPEVLGTVPEYEKKRRFFRIHLFVRAVQFIKLA